MNSTHFKHYEILNTLGVGGFGEVFEAWDSKLRRKVALKRLKAEAFGSTMGSANGILLHEARMGAQLEHSAFVKVHAIEEEENSQTIVMELVRGQTIKQLLQEKIPPLAQSLDIVRQVAQAMQEAHNQGLIHADLKPSNLMLEANGRVRILDFGLASQADPQVTTSIQQADPQGTISYMAPERMKGAPASVQSDVYALGVILYELVSGKRPFADLNGLVLAAAHMQSESTEWPWPDLISAETAVLIKAMTAQLPAQRMQTMQDLLDALASADKLPCKPARAGLFAGVDARLKRPWLRVMGASVLGATLLGSGAWWMWTTMPQTADAVRPYSEAAELKNGLTILKVLDRPGNLDRATTSFMRVLKQNPNNATAVAGLAIVYSFRYQNDERDEVWLQKAAANAQQAMTLNDHLGFSYVAKAIVLLQQSKYEEALTESEHALRLDPENMFAWIAKTGALRGLQRFEEAHKVIARAEQRFPGERFFIDEAGLIYLYQRDNKSAEITFKRSIAVQPDAVFAYNNLATLYIRQNRLDEALHVLQQGLQIRPNSMMFGNLGNVLFLRGDYPGAARAFEQAVSPTKGNPADYLGWANLGDALRWIAGRETEAKRAYAKAGELLAPRLARRNNDVTLMSRMGLYAARSGNTAEAMSLMRRAVDSAPNNPDVHFRAGLAYELLGDRRAALAELAKARTLGYSVKAIEAEPDLVALRRDPDYVIP